MIVGLSDSDITELARITVTKTMEIVSFNGRWFKRQADGLWYETTSTNEGTA